MEAEILFCLHTVGKRNNVEAVMTEIIGSEPSAIGQEEFMEAIADVETLRWDWPGDSDIHARIVLAAAWVLKAIHGIPDEEVFEPPDGEIAEFVAAIVSDEPCLQALKGIAENLKVVRRDPDPSVLGLLPSGEN